MNTRQLAPVRNPSPSTSTILAKSAFVATTAVALGASAIGLAPAIATVLTAGTLGSYAYSYFSRSKVPTTTDTPSPKPLPDIVPTPAIVKPVTQKELFGLSPQAQQLIILERTRQLHEQEANKAIVARLLQTQNAIVKAEKETDMDLEDQAEFLERITRDDEREKQKRSFTTRHTKSPVIDVDNIGYDSSDESFLEELKKAEVERTRKNSSEVSQNLVKSSSEPANRKRKLSETKTPSASDDCTNESPPKKSKSISGTAVAAIVVTKEKRQKCSMCGFQEMRLWATDPKDGKQYCFDCHTVKRNLCSYKPQTGGRACFRKNTKECALCDQHLYTTQTFEMDTST